eukprot:CAMPEP_0170309772 /NCGR_PEP_ID=MMETSP0116_2-20130129/55357_1 /TAXON_ID=400756 /ORGANISM="Durinskia baltica, Strain CSIRO CS-38" /LENGTH=53 /DNA_ID=CAMNT_0010562017 /DNA_START=40 /DNA_END=198 /DNA_ORIENTATION=-
MAFRGFPPPMSNSSAMPPARFLSLASSPSSLSKPDGSACWAAAAGWPLSASPS